MAPTEPVPLNRKTTLDPSEKRKRRPYLYSYELFVVGRKRGEGREEGENNLVLGDRLVKWVGIIEHISAGEGVTVLFGNT